MRVRHMINAGHVRLPQTGPIWGCIAPDSNSTFLRASRDRVTVAGVRSSRLTLGPIVSEVIDEKLRSH